MINLKDVAKKERAKAQIKAPAAADPGNGKTPAELEKEILKNHKAMLKSAAKESKAKAAIEAEAAKEPAAKDELIEHETKPISDLEVFTTEPVTNPNEICPFCEKEKSAQGMSRHIIAKHGIRGITIEDLNRIEQGEITPDALADEKKATEIFGLSPEVDKKYFSSWDDIEENPKDPEALEDPEGSEDPEALEDPEGSEDPEKEAKRNGAGGVLPLILIIGIPAAIILSRIPKFKEIGDNLLATLGDLGSKKFPQSPGKKSYGQHAVDVNRARNKG